MPTQGSGGARSKLLKGKRRRSTAPKLSAVDREPTEAPAKPKPPPPPGPPPTDLGPPPPNALVVDSHGEGPRATHRGSGDAAVLHRPPGWVPPEPSTADAVPHGAHLTVLKKGGGAAILARKRGGGRKRSSPGRRATMGDLGSSADLDTLRAFGDGTPGSALPKPDVPRARAQSQGGGPPGRSRKSSSLLAARGGSPSAMLAFVPLTPSSPLSAFVDAMNYAYGQSAATALLSKVRATPSAFGGDERQLVVDCALHFQIAAHPASLATEESAAETESAEGVSVLLCTVTFYANFAHSLTRSP